MSSAFATAMLYTETANGAKSILLPDANSQDKTNGRISLFFKGVRDLNIPQFYQYLREAASENIIDTIVLLFNLRDCRGGKGERELGKIGFRWFFINYPKRFMKVFHLIPEYGMMDYLLKFFTNVLQLDNIEYIKNNWCLDKILTEENIKEFKVYQNQIVQLFSTQLEQDKLNMLKGEPVSLCAKWAPTENDSMDTKYKIHKHLCKKMNIKSSHYRKQIISPLRQYLNIVERMMCSNDWDSIDYSKVPSCAMKKLKEAFLKHTPDKFNNWKNQLVKGEVKINAKQLFPHELICEIRKNIYYQNDIINSQWLVLEEENKKLGSLMNTLCVCDVSLSMDSWGLNKNKLSFTPMDVAIGLSLLISNTVSGPFNNHVISFHEHPTFHQITGKTLTDKYSMIKNIPWGGSTNLTATFNLILNKAKLAKLSQEDMPKKIIIFSDMQFNVACPTNSNTNFEVIDKMYKDSGYKRPTLIFWNITGNINDFPVSSKETNTAMLSGFSPDLVKSIMHGESYDPYSVLRRTIENDRYKIIYNLLK